jgi:hypothetical protein
MTQPNHNEHNHQHDDSQTPDGVIDLSYELSVETRLIKVLEDAIGIDPTLIEWLSAAPCELPALWGIDDTEADITHPALLLGSIAIVSGLVGGIHEESVPGLLNYLANFHDLIDTSENDEEQQLDHRYLFAQIVHFCKPNEVKDFENAFQLLFDYAFIDDETLDSDLALAVVRYLMLISILVLGGDNEDSTKELIDHIKECNNERCLEPIQPYFEDEEDQEDYGQEAA